MVAFAVDTFLRVQTFAIMGIKTTLWTRGGVFAIFTAMSVSLTFEASEWRRDVGCHLHPQVPHRNMFWQLGRTERQKVGVRWDVLCTFFDGDSMDLSHTLLL